MPTRLTHDLLDERPLSGGGRRIALRFGREGDEERVPGLLLVPDGAGPTRLAPAAVLLHGYSSRKEDMAELVGRGLLARGIASLAIDLPLHGERRGDVDFRSVRNPLALTQAWRRGLADGKLALGYLGARPEVDADRLAITGYSMGSFLGVQIAADAAVVRALVLAAGGDLPTGTPFDRLVRAVADPLKAVRRFDGRPLLMVHGRRDTTVRPDQAQRLFDAASEPKELRWYDAGHYLPASVIDDAAAWLADRLARAAPGRAD
ncbi:MAG TPA: alpha/beta fold hydrolase, partial [Gemmatirosa sp.]